MALFTSRVARALDLAGIGLFAACLSGLAVNGIAFAETPPIVADPPPAAAKPRDWALSPPQKRGPAKIAATPIAPQPSAAEIVGNLLAPKASDPDVPLPQPGLAVAPPAEEPPAGARIFGRSEDGGEVLGVRIPIPASGGAFDPDTRYSSDKTGR